jgi:hypothetical protein
MDWTGGLIERPRVPVGMAHVAVRLHVLEGEERAPRGPSGRRPESALAQVKALLEQRGPLSTDQLAALLPHFTPKAVAVAARNLAHLKETRQAGKAPRSGNRGSGCAIWEIAA